MCLNHDCPAQRGATPSRPSTVAMGDAGEGDTEVAVSGQKTITEEAGEGQEGVDGK